jgi:hypothetical protein
LIQEFAIRHLQSILINLVLTDTMALLAAIAPAVVGWRNLRRVVQLIRFEYTLALMGSS